MKNLSAGLLVLCFASVSAFAQMDAAPQPLKHSDVVFMGGSSKEAYQAYGATVVDWGGHAGKNEDKPKAEFRARVKAAQDLGIQYNAGIGMLTEFLGMIDSCPEHEKAICRDIEGKPITVPWLWDHKVHGELGKAYWFCSNSPLYQQYLRDLTARAMAGEPDGFHIDDYGGTAGAAMWNGGCFCESCMAQFRAWLKSNVAEEKLRSLGIGKLDDFDYGNWLRAKGATNSVAFKNSRTKFPLDAEFKTFQAKSAGEVVRQLQEYAAKLRGKPLARSVNGEPPSLQAFVVSPHVDHFSCEVGMGAPGLKFTTGAAFTYKCGDMVRRGIAGTASGQDWAYVIDHQTVNLTRYWIAESYAFGHCFMAPSQHQWAYSKEKGTHWLKAKPEDYADLYKFVRANSALFDGYESAAQVGVVFSHAAWRANKKDPQSAATALLNANIPFALVAAGDEFLDQRLDAARLRSFDRVIVPADPMVDPAQQKSLDGVPKDTICAWKNAAASLAGIVPWVSIEGATNVWALPRKLPGKVDSPVVVHLMNRNYDFATDKIQPRQNVVLHLRAALLDKLAPTKCRMLVANSPEAIIPIRKESDGISVTIPELGLWAVLQIE